jgi:hypothetical protein
MERGAMGKRNGLFSGEGRFVYHEGENAVLQGRQPLKKRRFQWKAGN